MILHRISLRRLPTASLVILSVLSPVNALAAPAGGGGMPWNSTFSKILDSIQDLAPISRPSPSSSPGAYSGSLEHPFRTDLSAAGA
jgi:hypothetical protein